MTFNGHVVTNKVANALKDSTGRQMSTVNFLKPKLEKPRGSSVYLFFLCDKCGHFDTFCLLFNLYTIQIICKMPEVDPLSPTGTSSSSRFPAARPRLGSNRSMSTDASQEVTASFIQSEVNELYTQESMQPVLNGDADQSDDESSEDVSEIIDENTDNDELNETVEITDGSCASVNDDESQGDTNKNDKPIITEAPNKFDQSQNLKSVNILLYISIFLVIVVIIPVFLATLANKTFPVKPFDIKTLKEEFPTQDPDLWLAFESGVQDVVTRNQPSTFILLYREEAKDTLSNLLGKLSKYAVCNITDCSYEPIVITDSLLNSSEIVNDFGLMITKYKGELEEKGVMVIKNLENVRGVSAQAFHSFCDEYTPLVEKSLFIFTMKVDKLYGPDKMKFVEKYFKNKWTDIKVDTFNALITRISSMVLEVMP